jgi:segregation and condensation protein B
MSNLYEGNSSPPKEFTPKQLEAAVEAILFVAGESITAPQIASAVDQPVSMVKAALASLGEKYKTGGLALQFNRGKVQLTSSPNHAEVIERFLGLDSSAKLSRAAIEALTIISYRQPVTRPQVDAIRGVNSDGVIRTLLNKGLIEEVGRAEGPGRPVLYATTLEFLQHFGLTSIEELPPFELDNEENGEKQKLLKD